MKQTFLAILAALFLTVSCQASAQAIGEAMQLNRQSVQGVGPSGHVSVPAAGSAPADVQNQNAALNSLNPRDLPKCNCAKEPIIAFVPGQGRRAAPLIQISSPSKDASIFYTTDGWTPTTRSTPYSGPFKISPGTLLQAIAFEPDKDPSTIASVNLPVDGVAPGKVWYVQAPGGVLHKGTRLRLLTNDDVSSNDAEVGDPLFLLLDQYVMDGTNYLVRRRTPVQGTITKVVRAGRNGKPGSLSFEIHEIRANGVVIPVHVQLTLSAPNPAAQSQYISDPSAVHVARAFSHGKEAEIVPRMPVIAVVSADTVLRR